MESRLNLGQHTNCYIKPLSAALTERAWLTCQAVFLDEPPNHDKVVHRRPQFRLFVVGKVSVLGQAGGGDSALLTTINHTRPFRVLGRLPEVLDAAP